MEPVADNWELLTEVFHQDELHLIVGLLSMAGIPAKTEQESAGSLYGLTVGPLARVKIMVPPERLEDAQKVITGQMDEFEERETKET